MRPIDADALIADIRATFEGMEGSMASSGALYAIVALKSAPTLTLDNLRPKGRWNIVEFDKDSRRITIECSECGMVEEMTVMAYGFGHNFCHICGADMRGGGEECLD